MAQSHKYNKYFCNTIVPFIKWIPGISFDFVEINSGYFNVGPRFVLSIWQVRPQDLLAALLERPINKINLNINDE